MTAGEELLAVEGLTVRRGGEVVLGGISWRTRVSEHWVILGANGSGKTSLLSALCGLLTPSGGEMRLLGSIYGQDNLREPRRSVALVGSALRQQVQDEESALEVIVSGLHGQINYWGIPTREEQAAATRAARRTGCQNILHRPWSVLSQGERQKVLIARALIAKPKILILDEPCAGLDPAAREQFLSSLQPLLASRNAPQLLFVTHHVEEIIPGLTHALALRKGRVAFQGNLNEVLSSASLSSLFGQPFQLSQNNGRFQLTPA